MRLHTVEFELELIALTRSSAEAPAASDICWPSTVTVLAELELVNENVRWEALARAWTET